MSLFAYQKADILINNREMRLVEFQIKNHFYGTEYFTSEDGLNLAFAIPDYDPTYATFEAGYIHWGYDD